MTEEGTPTEGWRAQLPDDLKDNEVMTQYEKIGDFAKAHIDLGNAKKDLDGKLANSIQLLKDDASDEDRATFFTKIGRPEKPEGYQFTKPTLPEDLKYDEDQEKEFRGTAHKLGLSTPQATGIYDWYHQNILTSYTALETARKKEFDDSSAALKKEWGDNYETNTEIAKRAAHAVEEKLGIKGFTDLMDSSGFGNNPLLVKAFHAIGTRIMDDKMLKGASSGEGEKSAAEVLYPEQK